MNLLVQVILACLVGGLLSVIAASLVMYGLKRQWMPRMVSFSAGLLMSIALLDLLPEALESGAEPKSMFALLLAGLLAFFALQRFAIWRHGHNHEGGGDQHSTIPLIIIGDSFHNFTDGILLAAAFLADPTLGWGTTLAIFAHEVPQEAGDFALLLEAGMTRARAFFWNGLSSLASVAGGVIGYLALDGARQWVPAALVVAAAGFLYISIADLLPRLRRERKDFHWHALFLLAGVALAAFIVSQH